MSFHHNLQGGPWYEETGPDAKYIREHNFDKFKVPEITNNELNNILLKHIPDSKNDFGSWRGYHSFNVLKELKSIIEKLYNKKINNSMETLNKKFVPYVVHYLYKPGGLYMKKAEVEFNNKKSELKI